MEDPRGLHLDALCDVVNILHDCGWELDQRNTHRKEGSHWFMSEIIGRIQMVIQLPFLLLQTVVCQTLRGLSHLVTGILMLDEDRIKFGLIDILSVLVQSIALPIITLLGFFRLQWAGDLTYNLCKELSHAAYHKEFGKENGQTMGPQYVVDSSMGYDPELRNMIACGITNIVEIPSGLILALSKAISYTLTGAIFYDKDRRDYLERIAKGSFTAFANLFSDDYAETDFTDMDAIKVYGKVADHRGFGFKVLTSNGFNLGQEDFQTADFIP